MLASMRDWATLRLDHGDQFRVELDHEDLANDEILVRRVPDGSAGAACGDLLRVLEEHLATAEPHAAGTTDRLLERTTGDDPRAT